MHAALEFDKYSLDFWSLTFLIWSQIKVNYKIIGAYESLDYTQVKEHLATNTKVYFQNY